MVKRELKSIGAGIVAMLASSLAVPLEASPRIFPFAMEGANLPNVWNLAGRREPAGSGGFLAAKGFSGGMHSRDTDMCACLKAATGRVLPDIPQKCDIKTTPCGKTDGAPRATVSSTGEIRWDATKPGEEWYAVDTPRTKFISAFGKAGAAHAFADGFAVTLGDTLMGWSAISFTELSPGRSLLAATGYQQPSGARLTRDTEEPILPEDGVGALDTRITTMKAMGTLPYNCEGIRATIRVPSADDLRVTPLDGDARPLAAPFVARAFGGFATFDISEKHCTVWYLVENFPTIRRNTVAKCAAASEGRLCGY